MIGTRSISDYVGKRYILERALEGYSPTAYVDSKGIPTIGVGINLRVRSNADDVFDVAWGSMAGLSGAALQAEKAFRDSVFNAVNQIYGTNAALNAALGSALKGRSLSITESEAKAIFVADLTPVHEGEVDTRVGAGIPQSFERLALFSLAYNNAGALLGPGIKGAVASGNHAEAWYEIRYDSNGDVLPGIAKRRYYESQIFGTHDTAGAPSLAQSTELLTTRSRHIDAITRYDRTYGTQVAVANRDYSSDGNQLIVTVQASSVEFDAAKAILIRAYAPGSGVDEVILDYKPITRGVAAASEMNSLSAASYTIRSGALMIGGDGADVIHGSSHNDVIYGGRAGGADDGAADRLYGGGGNDRFYTNNGDKILADTKGGRAVDAGDQVFFNGRLLIGGERESKSQILDGTYQGQDGTTYTYSHGTLTVSKGGGAGLRAAGPDQTVEIENFRNGDAGIRLRTKDTPDGQHWAQGQASPIVIDLNGDGVRPTPLSGSEVYFDIDDDGFAERTSWVSSDDGLLAVDLDGDGRIGSAAELFGTNPLVRPAYGAAGVTSAFASLAEFDSNGDRLIDARDDRFGELRIWRDANSDGQTDEGEMVDLATAGIVSIGLDYTRVNQYQYPAGYGPTPQDGWTIFDRGRATTIDGRVVEAADVFFAVDQFSSYALDRADPAALAAVADLPFLIGSGNVRDLDDAMARDPLLRGMMQDLATLSPSDLADFIPRVMDLVIRWTGADTVSAEGRGGNVNGQWLAALEAINGEPYDQHGYANPYPNGGSIAGRTFNEYLGYVAAALLGQTQAGQAVLPGLSFDGGAFFEMADGQNLAGLLSAASTHAPSGLGAAIGYWQLIVNTLEQARSALGLSLDDLDAAIGRALPASLAPFTLDQIRTAIWTTPGLPVAIGNSGFDFGVDTPSGASDGSEFSNNLFVIRPGGATIYDGTGADRYVISGQHVVATINDFAFNNAGAFNPPTDLLFFENSRATDLTFTFSEGGQNFGELGSVYGSHIFNVVIRDAAHDITVTLNRAIMASFNAVSFGVDTLRFADGTEKSLQQIWSQSQKTEGNDILFVSPGVAEDGGAGNDLLVGSTGNDIYLLRQGSGSDRIIDGNSADADSLRVDAPLSAVHFQLSQDFTRNELIVSLPGGDSVTIVNQTSNAAPVVTKFIFSGGTVLTAAEVYGIAFGSTSGDDHLVGTRQADVLDGGAGDDILEGRGGDDIYRFAAGSGHDTIVEVNGPLNPAGRNRLDMVGINWSAVTLDRVGPGGHDLRLSLAGGHDSIVIEGVFGPTAGLPIATINFADGARTIEQVVAALAPPGVTIQGTPLNDQLDGTPGNDVIDGHEGDDRLVDGGGSDDYRLARGDGRDTIAESGFGRDRIVFANDVALGDLRVTQSGSDLVIGYGPSDQVTIVDGALPALAGDPRPIEEIRRADGAWHLAVTVSDGSVNGTDGDDLLASAYGGAGDFRPGQGTDLIVTGIGDDTVHLERGFGVKYVTDSAGLDTIMFGAGITRANLSFARDGRDLVIALDDGSVVHWAAYFEVSNPMKGGWGGGGLGGFDQPDVALDSIRFADGTSVDWQAIDSLFFTPDASDQLILRSSVLDGGLGNDLLEGDSSDNIYVFGPGYGHDVIRDFEGGFAGGPIVVGRAAADTASFDASPFDASYDVLKITGGLTLADLKFEVAGEHDEDIRISIVGTGDSILIDRDAVRRDGAVSGEIETLSLDGQSYDIQQLLAGLVRATEGDDRIRVPSSMILVDAKGGSDLVEVGSAGGSVYFSGNVGHERDADRVRFADDVQASAGKIAVVVDSAWTLGADPTAEDLANALTFRPDAVDGRIDLVITLNGRSLRVEGGIGMTLADGSFASTLSGVQFYNVWLDPSRVIGNALAARGGTEGDDTIIGTAGPDVIAASPGDDRIYTIAGDGIDRIEFGRGSGHDRVSTDPLGIGHGEGALIVRLAAGIHPADVDYAMTAEGMLQLSLDGGVDTLLIDPSLGQRNGANQLVGGTTIGFADGTSRAVGDIVDQLLVATAGDDILIGDDRDQLVAGGAGNDLLMPGGGLNLIRFGRGDGSDTVRATHGGTNTVAFGDRIAASDLSFRFSGDGLDLVVLVNGTTDRLTIENFFATGGDEVAMDTIPVTRFAFADGSTLGWQAVTALAHGLDLGGDDIIRGGAGGMELTGGAGTDQLLGGTGSDLYWLQRGDGEDRILDAGGSDDTVHFGPGISPESLRFSRPDGHPSDLLIEVDGQERATLTIEQQFAGDTHRIEWFAFEAGETMSWSDVQVAMLSRNITPGNDSVTGFDGNDRIDALAGDDSIAGGRGDDVLIGGQGFDMARLSGWSFEYSIVAEGDGYRVTDSVAGRDGSDFLTGIEALWFDAAGYYSLLDDSEASWSVSDITLNLTEDERIAFDDSDLLAAVVNPDHAALSIELLPSIGGSALWSPAAGQYLFAPALNFNGLDARSFAVVDAEGHRQYATIFFDVGAVNDAPLSQPLELHSPEDFEAQGQITALDADYDDLAYTIDQAPAHGSVTLDAATGEFTYVPVQNYAGNDSFRVKVSDGHGGTGLSSVLIVLQPINDAPVAGPLADQTGREDVAVDFAIPAGTFTDVDGDALALTATRGDGSALPAWLHFNGQRFTGTPPANFNGIVDLQVTASDGTLDAAQSLRLVITPVNDAPVVSQPLPDVALRGGDPVQIKIPLGTFTDPDGDPLAWSAMLAGGTALPTWLHFDAATGLFTGTAPASGPALSVAVTASDGLASATDIFTISIGSPPPVATDDSTSVNQGATTANLYTLLLSNDSATGSALSIQSVDAHATTGLLTFDPASHALTYVAKGGIIDQLAPGQTYTDHFSYTVTDGLGHTATASVAVTITGVATAGVTWNGGNGNDTYTGTNGNDVLAGGNGNDSVSGLGGNDRITGDNGDDRLDGGTGNDTLTGGNGNDVLLGGAGDDVLKGDNGNDVLDGGAGDDVLTGDNGSNRFVIGELGGHDRITDFGSSDRIDLSSLDAVAGTTANDAFHWIGSAAFSHSAGELRLVSAGGEYTLMGDVNGDGVADFTVVLNTAVALASIVL